MTVIRRSLQPVYNYSSNNNSDTESLNLSNLSASDTESVISDVIATSIHTATRSMFRRNQKKLVDETDNTNLKSYAGKKKLRRHYNTCTLRTLHESEEDDVPDLMESYCSPFTRLLEDRSAFEFWNTFIERSEEEQIQILDSLENRVKDHRKLFCNETKSVNPFSRISSKIKRMLKIKNNALPVLNSLENEIVDYFVAQAVDVWVRDTNTSFERLLLHGIAQYHALQSISVNTESKKKVELKKVDDSWTPVIPYLHDVIKPREN